MQIALEKKRRYWDSNPQPRVLKSNDQAVDSLTQLSEVLLITNGSSALTKQCQKNPKLFIYSYIPEVCLFISL